MKLTKIIGENVRGFRTAQGYTREEFAKQSASDLVDRAIHEAQTMEPLMLPGWGCGVDNIDQVIGGVRRGEVCVLGARPTVGKSALLTTWNINALTGRRPTGTYLWSGEMAGVPVMTRFLANMARVDSVAFSRNRLNKDEWARVEQARAKIKELPLFIDTSPAISVLELRSKVRRASREQPIGVVFVDYIQLMSASYHENDNTKRLTDVSKSLKAMAVDLDVALVVVSSMNRASEIGKQFLRPTMSQLRESGQIESDADIILLLWQQEIDRRNIVSRICIVEKQRMGRQDDVAVDFNKPFSAYSDPTATSEPEQSQMYDDDREEAKRDSGAYGWRQAPNLWNSAADVPF